jgi:hypothetical protein
MDLYEFFSEPPNDNNYEIIIPDEITNNDDRAYFVFKTMLDFIIVFIKINFGETINLDDVSDEHISRLNDYMKTFYYKVFIERVDYSPQIIELFAQKNSAILSKNKNPQCLVPTDFYYVIKYPNYYYKISLKYINNV